MLGYFHDEIRSQQHQLAETLGNNILNTGYCVHPDLVLPEKHPEQGPIWEWYVNNIIDIAPKLGANYHGEGPGALREIHQKNLEEIRRIYEVTGGLDLHQKLLEE